MENDRITAKECIESKDKVLGPIIERYHCALMAPLVMRLFAALMDRDAKSKL